MTDNKYGIQILGQSITLKLTPREIDIWISALIYAARHHHQQSHYPAESNPFLEQYERVSAATGFRPGDLKALKEQLKVGK